MSLLIQNRTTISVDRI